MEISDELRRLSNPDKIERYRTFHKTGEKGYAYGEEFLGVTTPQLRKLASRCIDIEFDEISRLLDSKIHEEKILAPIILSEKFNKSNQKEKKRIFDFSMSNAERFSGWDLVDTIAPGVIGKYLVDKDKIVLVDFAKSDNLWKKRIAIVSTYNFIKNNEFDYTLKISRMLLADKHDLIHKAVGWMLREIGKRDEKVLKKFLRENYSKLPRTTLRYAIERFPENERKKWLKGNF